VGQEQVPPGVGHVSPTIVQSAFEQQLPVGMQVPLAAQAVCPTGQLQVPPGPEHVSPEIEQSVLVQQVVLTMHWLLAAQAF
jgi:hypothetical protein